MKKSQSSLTSFFSTKRKAESEPAEEPPKKKGKSDSFKPLVLKLTESSDEIEDSSAEDTEEMDMNEIDLSVRAVPYVSQKVSQKAQMPLKPHSPLKPKTNEVVGFHQLTPKKQATDGPGQWFWLADDNTWTAYPEEISQKIEKTFVSKSSTQVNVDDQRFIDLENFIQMRHDNHTRKRWICRRILESPQHKHAPKPSTHSPFSPQSSKSTQSKQVDLKQMKKQKQNEKFASLLAEIPARSVNHNDDDDTIQLSDDDTIPMADDIGQLSQDNTIQLDLVLEDEDTQSIEEELPLGPTDAAKQLELKRSKYKCGVNFTEVGDIPTWTQTLQTKFKNLTSVSGKYAGKKEINDKVSLWVGDITALEIDAIVNAAKASLLGGGGVDGAIHKAAGSGLVQECQLIGGCNVGQSRITGAYKLPAKHVIHTVGPIGEMPKQLRNCYNSALNKAISRNLRTLAFCCISTGIFGYPNLNAAHVALETVRLWIEKDDHIDKIDRIVFCMFMDEDVKIYRKLMSTQYFPPEDEDD